MWLAIVFYCTSPNVFSCEIIANSKNLWYAEEDCVVDASEMAMMIESKGAYTRWACFELGEST